jgi:hypothetical protein
LNAIHKLLKIPWIEDKDLPIVARAVGFLMKGDFTSFPSSILIGIRFILLRELNGLVTGHISVSRCMPVTIYDLSNRQSVSDRSNLIVVKNKSVFQEDVERIVALWNLGEVTMYAQDKKRLCLEFHVATKEQIDDRMSQENKRKLNKTFYWFDELDENLNVKVSARSKKSTNERPTKRRKHK